MNLEKYDEHVRELIHTIETKGAERKSAVSECEELFEIAQQPLVFVCRALRDAHAHFGLPPLHIVGKARNEHHRVACRVQVALFDLRGIGRIASASSLERMSMIFTRKSFSRSLT